MIHLFLFPSLSILWYLYTNHLIKLNLFFEIDILQRKLHWQRVWDKLDLKMESVIIRTWLLIYLYTALNIPLNIFISTISVKTHDVAKLQS